MQKSFIAVALLLGCAFAAYTPTNYVKAPTVVAQDSETNFTNQSAGLQLASINIGELDLVAPNFTANTGNTSANSYTVYYRKLDSKALTTSSNASATFTGAPQAGYFNGYAISFNTENDTGIPQVRVYQTAVVGGTAVARLTVSSNTNASYTPVMIGGGAISKTFYVFTLISNNKVNVTNFVAGSATLGSLEFTFSSTMDTPLSLSVAWGESLGSNQLFAAWLEAGVLKDSVVDVSKGTVAAPTTVGAYDKSYSCSAYATDKKWYGDICISTNSTAGTINYYVRSNTTSLAPLPVVNSFLNTSTLYEAVQYGPYLALVYTDSVTTANMVTYAYEIWNLDTYTTFKNRTQFLTIDGNSTVSFFRVTSGGLYTLLSNKRQATNGTLTNVQVGLLLGSSYLTTIFGFLLTIIAGLLAF